MATFSPEIGILQFWESFLYYFIDGVSSVFSRSPYGTDVN